MILLVAIKFFDILGALNKIIFQAKWREIAFSEKQEFNQRKNLMNEAMNVLNLREKEILTARRLSDEATTLEDLSKKYKISRERIRQIETKAFEKLQKAILAAANTNNLLPKN